MDAAEVRIDLGADAVACKLNDGQTGFYRVQYADPQELQRLGVMAAQKALPPEDRWGLQNDLYALTVRGEVALADYLGFLDHYRGEDAYLPLASIASNLSHAHGVVGPGARGRIESLAGPWFGAVLERIGYEPLADEAQTTAILRDQFLFDAIQYGCREAEAFALKRFQELLDGGRIHPDILRSVMQAGAHCGDDRVLAWFDRRFQASESEHERLTILAAIGCFRRPAEIRKVLDYTLASVPLRNAFIPVVALAANPQAASLLWDWYVSRLAQIEQFHPMLYERVIAAVLPAAGLERPDDVLNFFADYQNRHGKARDVIRLSLERLEISRGMRRRNG
jgi:aminopeptidase N